MRILPDVGEVGVINDGGRLRIVEPSHESLEPISIDSATSRFAGFLSTNLANVEFPSAEVRHQHIEQGVSAANAVYDYFYTQDAVKVGVKFFVSYRITNPDLTLEHLSLEDISKHIEAVVNSDMGNAIQQTSIQNLLSSNLSKPHDTTAAASSSLTIDPTGKGKARESESRQFSHWQDKVKTKLKEDLHNYGIELVRLNIEEAKILNADIEKEMSEQAVTVAKANAEKAALDANLAVQKQRAAQDRELALLTQQTQGQVLEQQARAQVEAAKLQAEATTIASQAELAMQSLRYSDSIEKGSSATD